MAKKKTQRNEVSPVAAEYDGLLSRVAALLEQGRRTTVRTTNAILTATYWEVGRQIVEYEQGGQAQAEYGEGLMERLGHDLTSRFGRGFSRWNIEQMRVFYLGWGIFQTASGKWQARAKCPTMLAQSECEKTQTLSAELQPLVATALPLNPSASLLDAFSCCRGIAIYVQLMSVDDDFARWFYEEEAIRGAWSVRQLARQIATLFYERTALSRKKESMILKGRQPKPEDAVTLTETIRDPYVLEFLDLKNEYSETDLEDAIIENLQAFLLEMGGIQARVFASQYLTVLPDEETLRQQILATKHAFETRAAARGRLKE